MKVVVYTNHKQTADIITSVLPGAEVVVPDRTKTPVEEIAAKYPPGTVIIGVMPLDAAAELRQRGYDVFLTRLDGKIVEQLTGQPYNPKQDYPKEIVEKALVIQHLTAARLQYLTVDEMMARFNGKVVAVFNNTMREALQKLAQEHGIQAQFVPQSKADITVGLPPTATKAEGIQISFPGTTGQLTADQMVEVIKRGQARIYWIMIDSEIMKVEDLPKAIQQKQTVKI